MRVRRKLQQMLLGAGFGLLQGGVRQDHHEFLPAQCGKGCRLPRM